MSNPDFKHPHYGKALPRWELVDDMVAGENLKDHLITRNPTDHSPENLERNKQIFKRASFAAVAGYTAKGLLGLAFAKDPEIEVPTGPMEYLLDNADGSGNSIYQIAQQATMEDIKKGRGGFLVDFPTTEGEQVSVADMQAGRAFATIIHYKAQEIINWRTVKDGANIKLSLVVLKTQQIANKDEFSAEVEDVITELRLTDAGQYAVTVWKFDKERDEWYISEGPVFPLDGAGRPLDMIPFFFYGSESDNFKVDPAPLYDIARLNRDHYNNSAIYEDSVYLVGQAQPWMSGLTQDHIKEMGSSAYLGSGRLIGVPQGEKFGIEQVQPNSLAKEAMSDKVEMMISIGAMFLERGSANKTATQSMNERETRHSALSLIVKNVSEALTEAMRMAARFMNQPDNELYIEISTDFVSPQADAQELREIIAGFMAGAFPLSDYFDWMKKHGYVQEEKTIEDFSAEVGGATMPDLDDDGRDQ